MAIGYGTAAPKPPKRTTVRRRKLRLERAVKFEVRARCMERDGYCRYGWWKVATHSPPVDCDGESEWAHLKGHRRSQTRGQAPERRHTTTHSLMLCQCHHQQEEAGLLRVKYLTTKGCDGPLQFTVG